MFEIGSKVMHPIYGLGTVQSFSEQEILGTRGLFTKILFEEAKLSVEIDTNSNTPMIRDLISPDSIEKVQARLQTQKEELPAKASERFALNMRKLKSNDVLQIAEVVRDLTALSLERKLPPKEQTILKQARHALATEIAFITAREVDSVDEELDELCRDAYYRF